MYDLLIQRLTEGQHFRYERKFYSFQVPPRHLEGFVAHHAYGFFQPYPRREVNNIYLDTPGRRFLCDNIQGCRDRLKVRIRWYGPLAAVSSPALELKIRRGLCGYKLRYPLGKFDLNDLVKPGAWQQLLGEAGLADELRAALQDLRPVLVNRYERCYYRSLDGRYRVTVDGDMRFYRHAQDGHLLRVRSLRDDDAVLELKYPPDSAAGVGRVTQAWPLRVSRHSKYLRGMELIEL